MSLIDRAKNIILKPKEEWLVVAQEEPDIAGIITGYVLPLALFSAICAFIGYGLIGISVPFVGRIAGIEWGLAYAIQNLIVSVASVFITAFVIDALAPSFGSEKNLGRSVQLVAYAYTPAWVGGVFNIFPPLAILAALAGLYGLYLMYLGFVPLKKTPEDKVVVYMVVSMVVLFVAYFIVAAILGALIFGMLGLR